MLTEDGFSPPEAAFITGQSTRAVQKAIDEGEITARRIRRGEGIVRRIGRSELLYLRLRNEVADLLQPMAKRRLYRTLKDGARGGESVRLGPVSIDVSSAGKAIDERIAQLREARELIVEDPAIRGGEPVLKGTRVPVYLLADLVRQGATETELMEDYPSVSAPMLKAALVYASAYPKRGRPRTRWHGTG